MVTVFDRLRRVLRDDGTCWVNLGSSFAGANTDGAWREGAARADGDVRGDGANSRRNRNGNGAVSGFKPKDMVPIPWMVAMALQADGWYLRSDIIWHKPNPMPESVTDRPTKAHEYVFLLTKRPKYFYDAEAVKEPQSEKTAERFHAGGPLRKTGQKAHRANPAEVKGHAGYATPVALLPNGRNRRSVWTIATESFSGAHFATYPTALVKPCILAGTSERGVCPACGTPWTRVVEKPQPPEAMRNRGNGAKMDFHGRQVGGGQKLQDWYDDHPIATTGWRAGCACDAGEPIPATVLDPFCGSGTTGLVALAYGRDFVGIDLSADYLALAEKRIAPVAAQGVLL